jgi:hypothetical protein
MRRALAVGFAVILVAAASAQEAHKKGGYIIQRDAEVAKTEPGPHQGPGQTVGHVFFDKTPNLHFSFRKRVLRPDNSVITLSKAEGASFFISLASAVRGNEQMVAASSATIVAE